MFWIVVYFSCAVIVGGSVFIAVEWVRIGIADLPDHPGRTCLLAGMLWPVLILGVAELVVLWACGLLGAWSGQGGPQFSGDRRTDPN